MKVRLEIDGVEVSAEAGQTLVDVAADHGVFIPTLCYVRDRASGRKIFSISGRGGKARIEIDVELANRMGEDEVRAAVDLCLVGTILQKRVGYDVPIGQRKFEVKTLRERTLGHANDQEKAAEDRPA